MTPKIRATQLFRGVGLGLMLFALGCQDRNEFVPPPPAAVTVAQPVTRDVVDWIEFTGTTSAQNTVELRARVRGYLERIAFEDGALVKQGDLLFVIEQTSFEAEVEVASANLAKADAAVQLADANLARSVELTKVNAVTREELDVDRAELATAQAEQRAAKATLTEAELNLQYCEVRAPITGRIGRHLVDVGNLVLPDQTVLAVIESIDPIYAYFHVSERDLLRFMQMRRENKLPDPEQQPPALLMALADEPDYPHQGVLDFRQLGIDSDTGTALRRGVFPNLDSQITPGMFVRIRAAVGAPQPRLLVEERAISSDQRGDYLLIVNDEQMVEYRPVRLGNVHEGMRVIEEGLTGGEWVVVNGLQRARPGTTVNPQRAAPPAAPPSPADAMAQTGVPAPGSRPAVPSSHPAGAVVSPGASTSQAPAE